MNINYDTCPINCPYNKIVKTRQIIKSSKHISINKLYSVRIMKKPLGCVGYCKVKKTRIDITIEKALLYLLESDPNPPATNHPFISEFLNNRTKELDSLISTMQY
ncbi:MAG: hypothetical protein FWD82_02535 [Defluviitaleaceae bacterium]|nr:hypothetical protein [Defluviitaleaceae bacterium]